jgi:hypothetical protein
VTTARHAASHRHVHIDVPWRRIGRVLLDLAEALWLCAVAAVLSLIGASVVVLMAMAWYQAGDSGAAVLTVLIGFAVIVAGLLYWAGDAR